MTIIGSAGRQEAGLTPPYRLRPFPALDGMRAFAVTAVVLFHFPTHKWVRGGLFGVDVFFVLSGFLVTAGLMDESSETGIIRVRRFLTRRAWRLVPGLLAVLTAFVLLASFFHDSPWFSSNPFGFYNGHPIPISLAVKGVVAALLYGYNFLLVKGSASPSPLGHLWTLAIEGQFYVGWVLALYWLVHHRPRLLLPAILTAITASACLPWLIWHGGTGANTIYFGTAPRLQQLLAGAAVAVLWRQGSFDGLPRIVAGVMAAAGGLTLLLMCALVGNVTFKYLGAETVTAASSAAVIVFLVTSHALSATSRLLALGPLTWLGRRSYGVYLWHWPLAEWTNRIPHTLGVPLGISLSLLAAEASWRLVERPAQRWSRRQDRSASTAATSTASTSTAATSSAASR